MGNYDFFDQLERGEIDLDALSANLPCCIHINRTSDFKLTYLDPKTRIRIGITEDEIENSIKLVETVHPTDLEKAIEICTHYLENVDQYSTISYIQRVKAPKESSYRTMYTTSKYIPSLESLLSFSIWISNIELTEGSIQNILNETDFILANASLFSTLSQREILLIHYWCSSLKNKEVASKLNVSSESLKSYKKRIYKKLKIHQFIDLHQYAKAFDLLDFPPSTDATSSQTVNSIEPRSAIHHTLKENNPSIYNFSTPYYPGFFHVNSMDTGGLLYLDNEGCKELGISIEEIEHSGEEALLNIMHPADVERSISGLQNFAKQGDENEILTYFQRIRHLDYKEYRLALTSVRLNLKDRTFVCISNIIDQLPLFSQKMINTLNTNLNTHNQAHLFFRLSKREKEIITELLEGHSAKNISDRLFISYRTVEQHKKNIYKKLHLNSFQELVLFMKSFNF